MEDEVATAITAIENAFQSLRSSIERRAFGDLEPCLSQLRQLFQFLAAHDPVAQELAQEGHQLVLWALENVRQYRSDCGTKLAESKQELQVLQNYLATSGTQAVVSTLA